MGLFDKLKNIMNTSSNEGDPLQDEIVKKYFNIIYDMRMSRGWFETEIADANSRDKRYIEFVLGETCDEGRFVKAVELINLSRTDYPNTKLEKRMVDYRNSLYEEYKARDYKSAFGVDIKRACEACYPELLAEIKSKYEAAIVADDDCKSFNDVVKKYLFDPYRNPEGYDFCIDSDIIKDCICVAIMDSFFEGNKFTQKVVLQLLEKEEDESLCESIDSEEVATAISSFLACRCR